MFPGAKRALKNRIITQQPCEMHKSPGTATPQEEKAFNHSVKDSSKRALRLFQTINGAAVKN